MNTTQAGLLAQDFGLSPGQDPVGRDLPAEALLDPATCAAMLDRLAATMVAPTRAVAASLLAKRHAFLATGAALYAVSAFDRSLDLSLPNCRLDTAYAGGRWQSRLYLRDLSATPATADRPAWRDAALTRLFAGHLAPLWSAFTEASRVPARVLWENTAVRVFSLYERRLAALTDVATQARIDADFRYLTEQAPGTLFGLDHNPLTRDFHARTAVPGKPAGVRFRRTCCLYYRIGSGELCSTCPFVRPGAKPPRLRGGDA